MSLRERLGRLLFRAPPPTPTGVGPAPLKIAFFGPVDAKRCPKSTALELAFRRTPADLRGELISIATEGDRTLSVEVRRPGPGGAALRVQLYCVAGPSYFRETRQKVLRAAGAVLFVPTTRRDRADTNDESLDDLDVLLRDAGHDPRSMPCAFVWLAGGELAPAELETDLNAGRHWATFVVDRETGAGIDAAVEHAIAEALAGRRATES